MAGVGVVNEMARFRQPAYNRCVDPMKVIIGLLWCFMGVVWLYRATTQEANPNAPVTLFKEPEAQSDKERGQKVWLGVLAVILGGIWILFGIFSVHH